MSPGSCKRKSPPFCRCEDNKIGVSSDSCEWSVEVEEDCANKTNRNNGLSIGAERTEPDDLLLADLNVKYSSNITELNLSGRGLSSLPEDDFSNLLVLNVSKNQLTELPQALKTATRLRVLDVSHNNFSQCPPILVDGLRMISTLKLSFNSLVSLPLPACAQHLAELSAQSCTIKQFPSWILYQSHSIESLDLSTNPVRRNFVVDDHHPPRSSVRQVRRLNVSNMFLDVDRMDELCRTFSGLEFLDVSNHGSMYSNRIVGCPENLPANLKVLKAVNSELASSPNFTGSQVEEVHLSGNTLNWLNEDFPVSSVRRLVLSNCLLCSLPDNFGVMVNLQYLNISNNDLGELPSSFASLVKLRHLDLYNNSLSTSPDVLVGLEQLRCLDLCQNYFLPPDHPTGPNRPSYSELREALRSSYPSARICGPRPDPFDNPDKEELQLSDTSESLSEHDDFENETVQISSVGEFIPPCQDDEDENWGAEDEDKIYSNFIAPPTAVPDEFLNFNPDLCFSQLLRYVPDRIKNSPMFFHRIDTRFVPPPKHVLNEECCEGQFDDA